MTLKPTAGWTPSKGRIYNCLDSDTGNIEPVYGGDRRMIMGIGANNFSMMPGDTQVIVFSQTLTGGSSNLNSVTRLKKISDMINYVYQKEIKLYAENFCSYVSSVVPDVFSLSQNYPNPFNSMTNIKFSIPVISDVRLEVFDVLGKQVELLAKGEYNPGFYEIAFNAKELPSGIYFYRLVVVDKTVNAMKIYSRVKKMALFKSDGTSYLDPTRPLGNNRYLKTKYIYSGDPETNTGWTPRKGRIANCGGIDSGYITPVYPGGANTLMGIGAGNLSVMPGDTQLIIFSQTLAAGIDTANAVTNLKKITDAINYVYQIDIKKYAEQFCPNFSIQIPTDYFLSQNYPNPFNSVTKIKFSIPGISDVRLEVFDVLGKQVELLANGEYNPGFYEIAFDAKELPSGIYFYRLVVVDKTVSAEKIYSSVKKMALLK